MNLNNITEEKAKYQITTANGREVLFDVNASTFQIVDLSKYQSPFSAQVTIGSITSQMIYRLDESHCVSIYPDGKAYAVSSTSMV
jgi:hypothetical protein